MRKDVAQNLAGVIALQVEDEEGAQSIIDRMTADGVSKFGQKFRSNIDAEVTKANQTHEKNLREKYDFKEKQQQQQQQQPGTLTLESLKAAIAEQLTPLTARMDAYDQKNVAATRRETYVQKLNDAKLSQTQKDMLVGNYDRMKFENDDDFNAFITSSEPMIQKLAQETADAELRTGDIPSFSNKNKDGVSQGVATYLESKGKEAPTLGGKTL